MRLSVLIGAAIALSVAAAAHAAPLVEAYHFAGTGFLWTSPMGSPDPASAGCATQMWRSGEWEVVVTQPVAAPTAPATVEWSWRDLDAQWPCVAQSVCPAAIGNAAVGWEALSCTGGLFARLRIDAPSEWLDGGRIAVALRETGFGQSDELKGTLREVTAAQLP